MGAPDLQEGGPVAHCVRHYEEPMEASCRVCHRTFCNRCLVYSFGPNKPPFCVGCALSASGVRTTKLATAAHAEPQAAEPRVDRRAERAERRAAKAEARAMRRAAKRGGGADRADDERSTTVPAPHDLSIPSSRYGPGEHVVS